MAIKTVILRFRDLSTITGDTIRLHNEKIDEQKFVWWGWWNKSNERVPVTTFIYLKKLTTQNNLNIFLFDSGSMKIYQAECSEIVWNHDLTIMESPNKIATPDYYSATGYKAWFKMLSIKELNGAYDEELKKYSYVEVSEFFDESIDHFHHFNDKQVISVEELKYQERTIWFLRDYDKNDKTHLIQLYTEKSTKLEDYILKTIDTDSNKLLWVSDLHFSEKYHAFSNGESFLSAKPLKDIINELTDEVGSIGGILSTGDFTFTASEDEFESAKAFIENIMKKNSLSPEALIVTPGNHDVRFIPKNTDKFEYKLASEENKREFCKFYSKLFGKIPNEYLSSGRRFLMAGSKPVEVVAINSHMYQQYEGRFRSGVITREQLQFAEEKMRWSSKSSLRPYRVVLLHYNLIPVDLHHQHDRIEGTNVLIDSEEFIRWMLKNGVNIVLHGHTHSPFYTKISRHIAMEGSDKELRELHILGMGSTGVTASHQGADKNNVCGILEFNSDCLKVQYYRIFSTGSRKKEETIEIIY